MAVEEQYAKIHRQLSFDILLLVECAWPALGNRLIQLRLTLILQGTTTVGESTVTKMRLVIKVEWTLITSFHRLYRCLITIKFVINFFDRSPWMQKPKLLPRG